MRSRRHIAAIALVWLVAAASATAQQKMGYVNTDSILEQIPEYNGIQQQLQVISSDWRAEVESMEQRIDSLQKEFESKEILFSDELKAQKQQEIDKLKQARQQYVNEKFGPEGEYFQRQQELLEPIQRNVYEDITAVSRRENIDFVFDRARNTSLIFAQNQWNLNKQVLQELGITLDE